MTVAFDAATSYQADHSSDAAGFNHTVGTGTNRIIMLSLGLNNQALAAIEAVTFDDGGGGNNQAVPGVRGQAVQLTGDDGVGLSQGNFTRSQPFSVSLWICPILSTSCKETRIGS